MKILSWNIQWGRGADGVVQLERVIADIRRFGVPDVICLQEVAQDFPGLKGGATGDQVAQLCEAFPEHTPCWGAVLDVQAEEPDGSHHFAGRRRARFGNLILSRLPVLQVFFHMLPSPPDDAGMPSMPRGVIEAVIQGSGGPLRVLTTHLEYYSARQRRAQVQALRELQQTVAINSGLAADSRKGESNPAFAPRPRPVAAVLCGDFNLEPDSVEYALMAQPLAAEAKLAADWCDAWRVVHDVPHRASVGVNGAEWPDRPYCCDFFWVSENLVPHVAALEVRHDTAASDHQPLVLTLAG